jgi:ethanolamine permease
MFPEHSSKVRPFVGPLQPGISYVAIGIAITILSTLFWGYMYNLLFALLFYAVAYFYFHSKHKRFAKEFDWGKQMGWPVPAHHRTKQEEE